ncbi:MAG: sulfur carrier protein ThiS [Hydrogenimonas sp.]|nr:sulfur carrier protein ThiS [Hydrogenimonas sp.]
MELTINGELKRFDDGTTLSEIINRLGIAEKVMAAAVNMKVVKKDKWGSYRPKDGDKIELLHFVGGG